MVQRRTMFARSTTGEPVLWTQRRRQLLLTPPTFTLRLEVLQPRSPRHSPDATARGSSATQEFPTIAGPRNLRTCG